MCWDASSNDSIRSAHAALPSHISETFAEAAKLAEKFPESTLENYHLGLVFGVLEDPKMGITQFLPPVGPGRCCVSPAASCDAI